MNEDKRMTKAEAEAYIARLTLDEKRQLDVFLRIIEAPTVRPRLLQYLQRQGLLEPFLEAERGGKEK